MNFQTKRFFGEKVIADDGDVIMTVTGFCFYLHGTQVQCSWFSNGVHQQHWFEEWRLEGRSAAND